MPGIPTIDLIYQGRFYSVGRKYFLGIFSGAALFLQTETLMHVIESPSTRLGQKGSLSLSVGPD
jgi:hypothetical protein